MNILLDTPTVLEFDRIVDMISTKCVSDLGHARLNNSQPFSEKLSLIKSLVEVSEAKQIYIAEGGIPIWSFDDIRGLIKKIEPIQSYLEITDCQKIQNFIEVSSSVFNFFEKKTELYPEIVKHTLKIYPLFNVLQLIKNTIDPSGSIYDNASPDLKQIRSQIKVVTEQIHVKLERIIKKHTEHLQDEFMTLRDGRLVIPVREFSVNKIPGIVHGQSATGQTHYVEPMSVVPLNNEIFELYNREKREIIRILQRLTSNFREKSTELISNQEILVHLDTVQAKAQYAISVNAHPPDVNDDFTWDVRNGYHPILLKKTGKDTVPLTLSIGNDYRMVIITGPNAGGKTVALKTIGLLQLMFQCGFHIPVDEGSAFPICNQLAAVIGDEQSIENDLSTFSSHITKLNEIVSRIQDRTLILVDEIGTGTDPAEGSALAIAFLETLNREGVITLVTTHLGELKAFAHEKQNVVNAAMQFDFSTLSPLFKLETGVPGSSYAFDISQRLGVDENILIRARQLMGSTHNNLDSMISALTKKRQDYDKKLNDLSIKESELKGLQSLYQTRSEDLKKNRKKYESEAIDEAREILEKVNKTIEKVIREIKESQADSNVIKRGRQELRKLSEKIGDIKPESAAATVTVTALSVGQTIHSTRFDLSGQITKIYDEKDKVEIDTGGVKMMLPLSDITIEGVDVEQNKSTPAGENTFIDVVNEIDLRGKMAEDALIELEKYLDLALHSNWNEIRIIHGKGTGALRSRIHAFLKKNKLIKSYRLGNYGEGDTGVTIIEMASE